MCPEEEGGCSFTKQGLLQTALVVVYLMVSPCHVLSFIVMSHVLSCVMYCHVRTYCHCQAAPLFGYLGDRYNRKFLLVLGMVILQSMHYLHYLHYLHYIYTIYTVSTLYLHCIYTIYTVSTLSTLYLHQVIWASFSLISSFMPSYTPYLFVRALLSIGTEWVQSLTSVSFKQSS